MLKFEANLFGFTHHSKARNSVRTDYVKLCKFVELNNFGKPVFSEYKFMNMNLKNENKRKRFQKQYV